MQIFGHILYLGTLGVLAWLISGSALPSGVVLTMGAIGLWRYAWICTNLARAQWYLRVAYPKMKRRAFALHSARKTPPHAFFLVTSFKIEPAVTARVYKSVFAAAARSGRATVVASVVDGADARLIRQAFASMPQNMAHVALHIDQIAGTGKRDALATGLRSIAAFAPSWRDIVLLVDGDTCVPIDIAAQSAPWFNDPNVGAVTTDERAEIPQGARFRDWFDLRFIQRHVLMSSMALSGRVLTLTGRLSIFRADLATDPAFIAQVQSDALQHWRLGHVRFLTGDDKSTWFWLLKSGYQMLYLPDVQSLSLERQPLPSFTASAVALMRRWYGNMLRTNARALDLSPRLIGAYTWWAILDQRVTIWTTLAGPMAVALAAVIIGPQIVLAYIAWVMLTRYVYCIVLALFRGKFFPISYPFLLYFGQMTGAAVKSYVFFRLDRQRWTRQTSARQSAQPRDWSSAYLHSLALGWLALGVSFVTGLIWV
jgi:mannuronan synthase